MASVSALSVDTFGPVAAASSYRKGLVRELEVARLPSTVVLETLVDGSGVSMVFAIQIVGRAMIVREMFELPRVRYFAAAFRFLGFGKDHVPFLRVIAKVA